MKKMSFKKRLWIWFPFCFSVLVLLMVLANFFTQSEIILKLSWIGVYFVPWTLFFQAELEANERWKDWLNEARLVCAYMVANNRILIMLNNVEDKDLRERLIQEYSLIMKDCVIEEEKKSRG